MPQLVRGGKHAFGWSRVGDAGRIVAPPEALAEYGLVEGQKLIVMPGSRTSGGFGLASCTSLRGTPLAAVLDARPELAGFRLAEGAVVEFAGRPYCWVALEGGGITLPSETGDRYGIAIGDRLLVIRGSGRALGFAVRGPIVAEAERHPELEVFGVDNDQAGP
jgi:bifunctional DNA-binding transcriptional regulator/antitoxin component of YhaV-PrlF toxin-antitoxin module